jgi:hypothetical protein
MTLDELLLEWSYRSERGYPSLDNPSDVYLLKGLLEKLDLPANEIISNLEEVRMIPSQLKGTITKGPFKPTNTGSDTIPKEKGKLITRLELLILKVENDEELELDNGSTIIVANKEEVLDILKSGNIPGSGVPLKGTKGEDTTTSQLKKTHEFGSDRASSGVVDARSPVVDTDVKEELVIVMCNILREGGNLINFNDNQDYINNFKVINNSTNKWQDTTSVGRKKIEDLFNLVGGEEKPLSKVKHIFNNPYSIAVEILKTYPEAKFDRGDMFNKIRKECSEITGLDKDKWNPGDIYIKNFEPSLPTDKDSIVPWNELFVNNWGDTDAPLVAISLKEEKYQPGRAKSYLKKFGDKSKFNLPKETLDAMSDEELKKGIEKNKIEIIKFIEEDEKIKFERKGDGWDGYPDSKTRLKAKFGCYRILNFLLNKQNDSSILGLFAFGLSIDRDERANPTFFKLVGGNKGVMTKKVKYPAGVNSDLDESTPIVIEDLTTNGNIKISGTIIKTDGDDFNEKESTSKTLRMSGAGQVQIV